MNVELLQKVKAYILEQPKRFNLGFWGASVDPKFYDSLSNRDLERELKTQRPPCGTVGCIAGNVCILTKQIIPSEEIDGANIYEFPDYTIEMAMESLDITGGQAKKLFFLKEWRLLDNLGWPYEFTERLYQYTPGTREYAQVAADRIDHFIKTEGRE